MKRNDLAKIGILTVIIMLGSCARGIIAPPGLNSKLTDLQAKDTDSATIITIKTNNLPQYASFTAAAPPSIILDLASTDASNLSKSMSIGNGFVDKVTVEQLGASTGYSARITVILEKSYAYTVTTDGNNILLNISKTEEQPAPAEGMQQSTTTGAELPSLAPLPGAGMSPTTGPEALAPLPGAGMSPTTGPEALAPLPGAEASPTTGPEALAPLPGAETAPSPATGLAVSPAPPPGVAMAAPIGAEAMTPSGTELSPTTGPEALAPSPGEGMTSVAQAVPVAGAEVSPPTTSPAPEEVTQAPSPAPAAVSQPAATTEEKVAMVVPPAPAPSPVKALKVRNNVLIPRVPLIFKSNEAVLSKDAEAGLDDVADYILAHQNIKLIIEGYSDASGKGAYNKELAYYRTIWVKMALERRGVPSDRLVVKPMGETSKFGHKKAAMAHNRRVVLIISKTR